MATTKKAGRSVEIKYATAPKSNNVKEKTMKKIAKPAPKNTKSVKQTVAPKKGNPVNKSIKQTIEHTPEGFAKTDTRIRAKERIKALGIKKTPAALTLAEKAMTQKRLFRVSGESKLDLLVSKLGKVIGIPDLSVSLAKDIARAWDVFDAKA
jgi:hypothetical protein